MSTATKTVCDISFSGYGTHIDNYPFPYLNAACAIGMTKDEVDIFIQRLDKAFVSFTKSSKVIEKSPEGADNAKDEKVPSQ